MTGSIGALNLLDCLHVVRQPDLHTRTTPAWLWSFMCLSACVLADNSPSDVCFASSSFCPERVSLSSAIFLLLTMAPCLRLRSFRQISTLAEQLIWENCSPVFFTSSVHPLRTSRAAVRKESVWLCSFSECWGSVMTNFLSRPGGAGSGFLLPSITSQFWASASGSAPAVSY